MLVIKGQLMKLAISVAFNLVNSNKILIALSF